jgi:cytidylate kinase
MSGATQATHLASLVGQLSAHWGTPPTQEDTGPRFTVAVARQAGTYARETAQEVARRLGWPLYDRELLDTIGREMGLQGQLLESVDEKHQPWLRDAFEEFMGVPHVNEHKYVQHLLKTVLTLGAKGSCVILGRGAVRILPLETTVRVRLVAPRGERVKRYAHAEGISAEEAARRIDATDRERAEFLRLHFQTDVADPAEYDIVLNTARYDPAACATVICAALNERQSAMAKA